MPGKKKITKKKLKEPDEFITLSQRAFLFISGHLKKVVAGGIVFLVILLLIIFFRMWEKQKEEEAYRDFSLAVEIYQRAGSPSRERLPLENKNALVKFDEVITKFPRTSSGKLSLLYKGNVYLRLGEFEEAIKAYQTFLEKAGKERLYRLFAMEGLGFAYQGKRDYENALRTYQRILEMGDSAQMADAYLNMGLCYEKLAKNKEALENYKAFLKASQKSMMTNVILKKISNLEK
jgi:tetratricopeptide (TPR) repeat protein